MTLVKSQIIKSILHSYDKDQSTTPYIRAISKIKNNTDPIEIEPQDRRLLNQVYQDYKQTLRKSNTLDFDDMVPLFLEALKKNPLLLQLTQYSYILIDECQDINQIQSEFIKTLSQVYQNIYMVGDEDQLIYSFRSSKMELLKTFQQEADEIIILNQNYRSTKPILTLSNRLISYNTNRTPKNLISILDSNLKPIYKSYTNTIEEAKDIVNIILTLKEPYEDIAILYRNNDQSYPIEKELAEHHIPYTIYGAKPFYENKEIKNILYTYRFLYNPNNEIALRTIYPSFIKLFGEDRWNQMEVLPILQEKAEVLCSYLDIEEIPILCDPIKEDSRYYPKENFIIISDKVIMNEVEALKSLIHEIRHHYQYTCVSTNNLSEPMLEQWRQELEIFDTLAPDVQLCTFLEIDAYAFTKVILKQWFNKDIIHYDDEYEEALNLYIKKYLS